MKLLGLYIIALANQPFARIFIPVVQIPQIDVQFECQVGKLWKLWVQILKPCRLWFWWYFKNLLTALLGNQIFGSFQFQAFNVHSHQRPKNWSQVIWESSEMGPHWQQYRPPNKFSYKYFSVSAPADFSLFSQSQRFYPTEIFFLLFSKWKKVSNWVATKKDERIGKEK